MKQQEFLAAISVMGIPAGVVHNYPAYVFRMTSLLEKLGVKNATYVRTDEVKQLCRKLIPGW